MENLSSVNGGSLMRGGVPEDPQQGIQTVNGQLGMATPVRKSSQGDGIQTIQLGSPGSSPKEYYVLNPIGQSNGATASASTTYYLPTLQFNGQATQALFANQSGFPSGGGDTYRMMTTTTNAYNQQIPSSLQVFSVGGNGGEALFYVPAIPHYNPPSAASCACACASSAVVADVMNNGAGVPLLETESPEGKVAMNDHRNSVAEIPPTPVTSSSDHAVGSKRKAGRKAGTTKKAGPASKKPATPKSTGKKGKVAQTNAQEEQQNSTTTPSDLKPASTSTTSAEAPEGMGQGGRTTTPPLVSSTTGTSITASVGTQEATATPTQAISTTNSYALPESLVSDSDDEGDATPIRKCLVCQRTRRFTEDVFETSHAEEGNRDEVSQNWKLLPNVERLIAHLNIPLVIQGIGNPSEIGICTSCIDSLQRWHIFKSATILRQKQTSLSNAVSFPVSVEMYERMVYRNYRKMEKVKKIYSFAAYQHLTRREITEKDWDFFCEHYIKSPKSAKGKELERYFMSREKLTHLYCIKCKRLVRNGRKGFMAHMKSQHPCHVILLPCDFCGKHFHDHGAPVNSENYFPHWVSHFYCYACEACGKKFPTNAAQRVHKCIYAQVNNNQLPIEIATASKPLKSGQNQKREKKAKGASVELTVAVPSKVRNHKCQICGGLFNSIVALRVHRKTHEEKLNYKCTVCNKGFLTSDALNGHKLIHRTPRSFKCPICDKAFKNKKQLDEHSAVHTEEKVYRCPQCPWEVRVKSELYEHMKIHEKIKRPRRTNRTRKDNFLATATTGNVTRSTVVTASSSETSPGPSSPASVASRRNGRAQVKLEKVEQPLQEQQDPITMTEKQDTLNAAAATSF